MLKKEVIYRDILTEALERKRFNRTQKELSEKYRFSLSTINNALKPLRGIGAIDVNPRGFTLRDTKKTLLYWATIRQLDKDIIHTTRMDTGPREIERLAPSTAIYTCYSGYKYTYNETPADYSEVYLYIPEEDLEEAKQRYPPGKGPANTYILKADPWLKQYKTAPPPQIYVDLWNLSTWYAGDYIKALEERLSL